MTHKTPLRRAKAAEYLQQHYGFGSPNTLAKLACVGGGPEFVKFGKFPLYFPDQLDQWVRSRMSKPVQSTAELSGSET